MANERLMKPTNDISYTFQNTNRQHTAGAEWKQGNIQNLSIKMKIVQSKWSEAFLSLSLSPIAYLDGINFALNLIKNSFPRKLETMKQSHHFKHSTFFVGGTKPKVILIFSFLMHSNSLFMFMKALESFPSFQN